MPRAMSSEMLAAIQAKLFFPAIFIQAQFFTGTIYIWTGYGTINWNGHTWQGVGSLLSVSAIEEGATVDARGITLGLSGIDQSMLADALQEFQVGAPVVVYLAMFDGASPPALLADPLVSWAGKLDQPTIDVGAETAVITINAESPMLLHNVPVERRYSQDDQVIDYPGDRGLNFVVGIQNQLLTWGRVPSASTQP